MSRVPMMRRYAKADAARCCEIINACLPQLTDMNEAARDYVRVKNTPAVLHAELDNFYTVVFEQDNEVVALGSLSGSEIKRVYVYPPYQSRGIGRAVMATLEGEAVQRGMDAVYIKSRPDAVPFYESLGYRIRSHESFVIEQSKFTIVRMEKLLRKAIS